MKGGFTVTQEELEARVTRLEDIAEIVKLQARYSHIYHMMDLEAVVDMFAQKTPGVTVEISDSGVYEGIEGVRKIFTAALAQRSQERAVGWFVLHMSQNPVIEINRDGKTARGLWHCPGFMNGVEDGKVVPLLVLGKYANDYVKEDGRWKFWHFHFYLTFRTPFTMGWIERPVVGSMAGFTGVEPSNPGTYYMPYHPDRINMFLPPPPEPES